MRSMRGAALGSALFLLVAPGTVVGLVPWWLTGWEVLQPLPNWIIAQVLGVFLIGAGGLVLVDAFVRFVVDGMGTPAPIAPPGQLIVSGFNRFVRNPMYVALIVIILGQALLLGQLVLVGYAALVWVVTATFVRLYEEPTLERMFGARYEAYRSAVPAWLPRLHPWTPIDSRWADTAR